MPLFIIYPIEPKALEQVLEVLGEPRDLEVEVRDERFKEILKEDEIKHFTIRYSYRPSTERVLKLYKEYYERYVNVKKLKVQKSLRKVLSFRVRWYVEGLLVEFDGFKLKIGVHGNISKAIELMQLFKEKYMNIEIDLSSRVA